MSAAAFALRSVWAGACLAMGASSATGQSPVPPSGSRTHAAADLTDETVRVLSDYLRIDTTNPPGGELATARFLAAILEREGIEARILDTAALGPGRANLYARWKGNGSGRKALALVHHMDVVPVSPAYWTEAPFGGTVKDGYVWGRGALDMKGNGIIQLMAMIALKRAGVVLDRDLVYIANSDEEVDGRGAIVFARDHRDLLADVEYLLTEGESARVENGTVHWFSIDVGEKRPYWQRLVVKGTASHGSVPTGDNPVPRLARAIARVSAWETPVRLTPAVERFFMATAATETGEGRRWLTRPRAALGTARGRRWLLSDPLRSALLRNTIAPTVIAGSNRTNIIPPEASAELDIRLLPDEDTAAFRRALVAVIDDPRVQLQAVAAVPPRFDAPLDTELYRAIERTAHALLPGVPVAPATSVGASDRPTYAQLGIVCYGLNPYLVERADEDRGVHGNDERISVANVRFGLRFYDRLLRDLR